MNLSTFMTMLCVGTNVQLTAEQAQIIRRKIETVQKGHDALDKTLTARLQRTGEIEQILFDMANGKLPLPSQQDCRVLAIRLGTPKAEWSEQVKEHKWEGQVERDTLAAQVEALKLPLKALLETPLGFGGSLQTDGQFAYRVRESVFKKAESALAATPQQHLAEIRAQAGRNGWLACWNWIGSDIDINFTKANFNDFADQYADSIRQEKK